MNNAFGMTNTTPHCERCGRPFKDGDDDASLWNIRFDAGSPRGHICPRCQTGIDSLEADINAIELESNGVRPLNLGLGCVRHHRFSADSKHPCRRRVPT